MAIPDGELYNTGELAPGQLATIERATINTEKAGAPIGFGQGVAIKDGLVVPATGGNIFGVALRRTYLNADYLIQENIDADKWQTGELFGVAREGTIQVPINEDVNENENAAVDKDGNFKPAGANDTVVGVFLGSGNKGGTARMQTRIQLSNTAVTGSGLQNANAPQVDQPSTPAVNPTPATKPASPSTGSTTGTDNKNGGK